MISTQLKSSPPAQLESNKLEELLNKYASLVYDKNEPNIWYNKLLEIVKDEEKYCAALNDIQSIIDSSHLIPQKICLFGKAVFLQEIALFTDIICGIKDLNENPVLENFSQLYTLFANSIIPVNPLPKGLELSDFTEDEYLEESTYLINMLNRHTEILIFENCRFSDRLVTGLAEIFKEICEAALPTLKLHKVLIHPDALVELINSYRQQKYLFDVLIHIEGVEVTCKSSQVIDSTENTLTVSLENLSHTDQIHILNSFLALAPKFKYINLNETTLDDQFLLNVLLPFLKQARGMLTQTEWFFLNNNFTLSGITQFAQSLMEEKKLFSSSNSAASFPFEKLVTHLYQEKMIEVVGKLFQPVLSINQVCMFVQKSKNEKKHTEEVLLISELVDSTNLLELSLKFKTFSAKLKSTITKNSIFQANKLQTVLRLLVSIELTLKTLLHPKNFLPKHISSTDNDAKFSKEKSVTDNVSQKLSLQEKTEPTQQIKNISNPAPITPMLNINSQLQLKDVSQKYIPITKKVIEFSQNDQENNFNNYILKHKYNMKKEIFNKLKDCNSSSLNHCEDTTLMQQVLLKACDEDNHHHVSVTLANLITLNMHWIHLDVLKDLQKQWHLGLREANLTACNHDKADTSPLSPQVGLSMQTPSSESTAHSPKLISTCGKTAVIFLPRPSMKEISDVFRNEKKYYYAYVDSSEEEFLKTYEKYFLSDAPLDVNVFYSHLCRLEKEMRDEVCSRESTTQFNLIYDTICFQKNEWDHYIKTKDSPHRLFKQSLNSIPKSTITDVRENISPKRK